MTTASRTIMRDISARMVRATPMTLQQRRHGTLQDRSAAEGRLCKCYAFPVSPPQAVELPNAVKAVMIAIETLRRWGQVSSGA